MTLGMPVAIPVTMEHLRYLEERVPQAMPGFWGTLATGRRESDGAAYEIGYDVDRLLVRQRRGGSVHNVPQSLAGPKDAKLFIDGRGVHASESLQLSATLAPFWVLPDAMGASVALVQAVRVGVWSGGQGSSAGPCLR
jgi:hypothetical protein